MLLSRSCVFFVAGKQCFPDGCWETIDGQSCCRRPLFFRTLTPDLIWPDSTAQSGRKLVILYGTLWLVKLDQPEYYVHKDGAQDKGLPRITQDQSLSFCMGHCDWSNWTNQNITCTRMESKTRDSRESHRIKVCHFVWDTVIGQIGPTRILRAQGWSPRQGTPANHTGSKFVILYWTLWLVSWISANGMWSWCSAMTFLITNKDYLPLILITNKDYLPLILITNKDYLPLILITNKDYLPLIPRNSVVHI